MISPTTLKVEFDWLHSHVVTGKGHEVTASFDC